MRIRIGSIIVFCILSTVLIRAQAVKLEYKYTKGTLYNYRDAMEGKTSQEIMGQEMKSEMNGVQVIRFRPESIGTDGSMVMVGTIDSAFIHAKGPGVDTTQVQNELIGKNFQFTLAKTGTTSKFTAVNPADNEALKMVENQIGKYPFLSDAGVSTGSTWSKSEIDTIEQGQFGGRLITDTKEQYTLVGSEMKNGYQCYKVTSTGTLSITGAGSMQGVNLKFEGTGRTTGTHYLAPTEGILVASETTVDIDMTVGAVGQQQMVIPMTQSMKMTRELLRK